MTFISLRKMLCTQKHYIMNAKGVCLCVRNAGPYPNCANLSNGQELLGLSERDRTS
jgi:hypothetical protein